MRLLPFSTAVVFLFFVVQSSACSYLNRQPFVTVKDTELFSPKGTPIILRGTNLGNWLTPEGYMFGLKNVHSAREIHNSISRLIGPVEARKFWDKYLENYITYDDITYIKKIGISVLRVPFNYRMLTHEDYLGRDYHGFKYLDRVIDWCSKAGIWVILDMHAAPGGQTGSSIDNGYGFPFLFISEENMQLTISLWKKIAARYKNNTTVIGYDLLNEPISHEFRRDSAKLNSSLEPLYKRIVAAIREVDTNHIVFIGGSYWNYNFRNFGTPFDSKSVYTFHKYPWDCRYISANLIPKFGEYLKFQQKYKVPLYLGEFGESHHGWIEKYRTLVEKHNISWTSWPYKKIDANSFAILSFKAPEKFKEVQKLIDEGSSAQEMRMPNLNLINQSRKTLTKLTDNVLFRKCLPNREHIKALGFKHPKAEFDVSIQRDLSERNKN